MWLLVKCLPPSLERKLPDLLGSPITTEPTSEPCTLRGFQNLLSGWQDRWWMGQRKYSNPNPSDHSTLLSLLHFTKSAVLGCSLGPSTTNMANPMRHLKDFRPPVQGKEITCQGHTTEWPWKDSNLGFLITKKNNRGVQIPQERFVNVVFWGLECSELFFCLSIYVHLDLKNPWFILFFLEFLENVPLLSFFICFSKEVWCQTDFLSIVRNWSFQIQGPVSLKSDVLELNVSGLFPQVQSAPSEHRDWDLILFPETAIV